jgi:hypothetical protein
LPALTLVSPHPSSRGGRRVDVVHVDFEKFTFPFHQTTDLDNPDNGHLGPIRQAFRQTVSVITMMHSYDVPNPVVQCSNHGAIIDRVVGHRQGKA